MSDLDVYKEWLGIPEGVRPPDYYTLLRLRTFEDDVEKIRSNYRKLNAHVRKYATGQYLVRSQELLNELAKAMLCLTDPDGKQEYDTGLGRAPAETESDDEPRTVLQYLVAHNVIKRSQVSEIERFAEARGLNHRDAVVQMKVAEPADAARALAAELRLPYVDLEDMLPEDSVLDLFPRRVIKKHSCLPLFEDRGRMLVACVDEPTPELEDEVRLRCGIPMRAVLAVPRAVNQAIAKYYAPGMREEAVEPAKSPARPEKKSKDTQQSKAGSSAANPEPAAKPRRSRSAPLTPEEKSKRMQITLIATCWATIGTIGIMYAVSGGTPSVSRMLMGPVAGAITFGVMKLTYAK